jgi:hypothetical protein
MTQATIIVPHGVEDRVKRVVKKRAAEKFGGFTATDGNGGWIDDNGDLVEEKVTEIKVAGADETWAKSTANWVAKKTDEQVVFWRVSDGINGLESA